VERLLYAGASALAEVELLAILMGTGLAPAAALFDRFGGLSGLERAGLRDLSAAPELDLAAACRIQVALALARRRGPARAGPGAPLLKAADVWQLCAPRIADEAREMFLALALDCKNRVQREIVIAIGTLTSVDVQPREAFRVLIVEHAASVIFVHNHPSGDPTPSEDDRALSRRLVEAGGLIGIRVLDHVVVAREGFASALHGGPICPRPDPADT